MCTDSHVSCRSPLQTSRVNLLASLFRDADDPGDVAVPVALVAHLKNLRITDLEPLLSCVCRRLSFVHWAQPDFLGAWCACCFGLGWWRAADPDGAWGVGHRVISMIGSAKAASRTAVDASAP